MGFKFTKADHYQTLHPNIVTYMETFVKNRLAAFEELKMFVDNQDFKGIRDYCHNHIGVAGSYKCYKLEEITFYIQKYARKNSIEEIVEVLPVLEDYLNNLKTDI